MAQILSIAESIKTPLMLAGMALLIMFLLLRLLLSRIGLERARAGDVGKVALTTIRMLFWLAIVLGALATASYVLTTLFDPRPDRVSRDISALSSNEAPTRMSALGSLQEFIRHNQSMDAQICVALTSYVRSGKLNPAEMSSIYPQDKQLALNLISSLSKRRGCQKIILDEADLRRANLSGMELAGASFVGSLLDEADLRRSNLSGASFATASLEGTNFANATATEADFTQARLEEAIFDCTDLSSARGLAGADLVSASLKGTNLKGVDLTDTRIDRRSHSAEKGDATCTP